VNGRRVRVWLLADAVEKQRKQQGYHLARAEGGREP
jgi:hypothetical protein